MKRDKALDIAKGIAIILMVYGHFRYAYYNMDAFYCWISSFHMPFFMYISGLLANVKTEQKHLQIIDKAKKILVPYAIWNVAGYVMDVLLGTQKQDVWHFFTGLVLGERLYSNLPTWYLLSFFWITLFSIIVLPKLDTLSKLVIADVISIALAMVIGYFSNLPNYFRLTAAVCLLPFFITGYLLKKIKFELPWWCIPPLLYIGFKLGRVNAIKSYRYIIVANADICVPYLYFLSAFCTTIALIKICEYLAKLIGTEILGVFGRYSLIILCSHWLIGTFLENYMLHSVLLFFCVLIVECIIIGALEWNTIRQKGVSKNE